jgi:hypothetical protein
LSDFGVAEQARGHYCFLLKRINTSKMTTNGGLLAIDGVDLAFECL